MNTRTSAREVVRLIAPLALCIATLLPAVARADNPVVQTNYTADPAPMVYEGRLYLYTTHDEDVTVNNFFTMNDWRVYSTVDMVNWTDHGSPLSYKSFSWGTGDAWAGQCIPRNGKFYFYAPINNSTGGKIGVAVSSSPTGPFTDALGKGLITTGSGNIDPTLFIDDDEQAYMYWGNPNLYYVKLNTDMISFPGSTTQVSLTTAGFGTRSNTDRATAYEEGPWFYKRGSSYYLIYPADGTPEKISYSTSTGPLGPWTYRGDIMAKQTGSGGSFTNHPGIVDFKGKSYFFYHNGALPGGGGFKRSVCVEEFAYNADGTIPTLKMTTAGPSAVANLNPFVQTEAETIAFSSGLKTEVCADTGGGMNVTSISNGDYIKVKSVDFATGATSFEARVASASSGSIELRLDSATGTLVATCAISGTGGAQTWATRTCTVSGATGLHDLFLKFTGGSGELFKFNWWKFIPRDPLPDGGGPDGGGPDGGPQDTAGDRLPGTGGTTSGTGGATGNGGGGSGAGGTIATGGSSGATASGGTGGRISGTGATSGTGGVRTSGGASGGTANGGSSSGGAPGSGGATTRSGGAGGSGGSASSQAGSGGAIASGGAGGGSGGASSTGGSSAATSNPSPGTAGCACQNSPGRGNSEVAFWLLLLAALLRRRAPRCRG